MRDGIFESMHAICVEGYKAYVDTFNQCAQNGECVTQTELVYLEIIQHSKGILLSEIAQMVEVSRPAATQVVNRLESKGYVKKETIPKDKRKVIVEVTDKYQEVSKQVKSKFIRQFEGQLTEDEVRVFEKAISKFKEILL